MAGDLRDGPSEAVPGGWQDALATAMDTIPTEEQARLAEEAAELAAQQGHPVLMAEGKLFNVHRVETWAPTCYLAHAIDMASTPMMQSADRARRALIEAGFVVYSPASAWSVGNAFPTPKLTAANNAVLDIVDTLFAIVDPKVFSMGTPLEILRFAERCRNLPSQIVVWTLEPVSAPWTLAGLPVTISDNLEQAVGALSPVAIDRRFYD